MSTDRIPAQVMRWHDDETEAQGWLVIDRLINGVSGGGLFMHSGATLEEVADLAATMSLKNTIQEPQFGGGKGGIRFDPNSPEAAGVLRRFMQAHASVIEHQWSTGGDLYTSNEIIERIAQEDLRLPSAFVALAEMLSDRYDIPSQAATMSERIAEPWNEHFSLGEAATGYSVAETIRLVATGRPRVAIQGFGTVGSSLAHFLRASDIGTVVGICEKDGWLSDPKGIDVDKILIGKTELGNTQSAFQTLVETDRSVGDRWTPRRDRQTDEEMLSEFITVSRPDVLSVCATRYALTRRVMDTFADGAGRYVVCGANNAFSPAGLGEEYRQRGLIVVPEWVSNAGTAILFVEILKTSRWDDRTPRQLFAAIAERIARFIAKNGNMIGSSVPAVTYSQDIATSNPEAG